MRRIPFLVASIILIGLSVSQAQTTSNSPAFDYYNQGLARAVQKDYDGAIAAYTKAIELNPRYRAAYSGRGHARKGKGDYDGAIADYTKVIELDGASPGIYNWRGEARFGKGDYDGAIADYTKAIELKDTLTPAHPYFLRGKARLAKKDYDGAWTDFYKTIELPGKYDESVMTYLTEAIRLEPSRSELYTLRGMLQASKRDADGAIADLTKAIDLAGSNKSPFVVNSFAARGYIRSGKGDYDGAIADLTEAIKIDPTVPKTFYERGSARYKKGDYDGAIADFTKVLELNPQLYPVYGFRDWVFLILNRGDSAYNDALKYLESAESDDESYYPVLVGYFGLRQSGRNDDASVFLTSWMKKLNLSAWGTQVIRFLAKEISEEQLLALAVDNDKKTEAHTYIGMNRALSGDNRAALTHLQWVIDNGNKSFFEYDLARAQIKRLQVSPGADAGGNSVAPAGRAAMPTTAVSSPPSAPAAANTLAGTWYGDGSNKRGMDNSDEVLKVREDGTFRFTRKGNTLTGSVRPLGGALYELKYDGGGTGRVELKGKVLTLYSEQQGTEFYFVK